MTKDAPYTHRRTKLRIKLAPPLHYVKETRGKLEVGTSKDSRNTIPHPLNATEDAAELVNIVIPS